MKARLVFRLYHNELNLIETEWVKFDNSLSFEEIQLYMRDNYYYLLSSAIEKLEFIHSENVTKEIISQILNKQGKVKIEFKDKALDIEATD